MIIEPHKILGKRLYLRQLTYRDASLKYLSWLNDSEIKEYLETPSTTEISQLQDYISKQNESSNSFFVGIFDKETNEHIGNIKLEPIDWEEKSAVFGTLIGNKNYWNKGYGREAVELVINFAFETLGLEKIKLGVIEYNERAIRCYQKCGFKLKERVDKCLEHKGIKYDNILMELTKENYLANKDKKIILKLALGTVQFGKDYGISNQRGKIPKEEIFKILGLADQNGISTLDSAYNYGDAEEVIGEFIKNHKTQFKIISKLPKDSLDIFGSVNDSLKRLGVEKLYGYLFHDFKSFLDRPGAIEELRQLKKSGKIERWGFSLYFPHELEYLLNNNIEFDLVQFPFSILDQRFSKYLPELKRRGIEVHVRSIFLQGLVFKSPDNLEEYFLPLQEKLKHLNSISQRLNTPISAICLNFALLNELVDKVIIGIESFDNFIENIDAVRNINKIKEIFPGLLTLTENDERLILPTNWPKKKK